MAPVPSEVSLVVLWVNCAVLHRKSIADLFSTATVVMERRKEFHQKEKKKKKKKFVSMKLEEMVLPGYWEVQNGRKRLSSQESVAKTI